MSLMGYISGRGTDLNFISDCPLQIHGVGSKIDESKWIEHTSCLLCSVSHSIKYPEGI